MDVKISTRHGDLTDSEKEIIEKKLQKLHHIFSRIEEIQVIVDWERNASHLVSEVEILVNCEHKHDLVAKATNVDITLIPAFDVALDKMVRRLRKYKNKIQDHRNESIKKASAEEF